MNFKDEYLDAAEKAFLANEQVMNSLRALATYCARNAVDLEITANQGGDQEIGDTAGTQDIEDRICQIRTPNGVREISIKSCVNLVAAAVFNEGNLDGLFPKADSIEDYRSVDLNIDRSGHCELRFVNWATVQCDDPEYVAVEAESDEDARRLMRFLKRCGIESVSISQTGSGDSTDGMDISWERERSRPKEMSQKSTSKIESKIESAVDDIRTNYVHTNYWDNEGGSMEATIDVASGTIEFTVYWNESEELSNTTELQVEIAPQARKRRTTAKAA